jgi:hypothetical protein
MTKLPFLLTASVMAGCATLAAANPPAVVIRDLRTGDVRVAKTRDTSSGAW